MEKEDIELLTKIATSYATIIGVGGATLYYMKQIREVKGFILVVVLLFYLSGLVFLIKLLRGSKFKW